MSIDRIDTSVWKQVFPDSLPEKEREIYLNRKSAVDDYLQGKRKVEDIATIHGISRRWLSTLVNRCLMEHPDGDIWGYRALIPNTTVKERKSKDLSECKPHSKYGGLSGAFRNLLDSYPELEDYIKKEWLGIKKHKDPELLLENRISFKVMHRRFRDKCRALGIESHMYPFNTKKIAWSSLRTFCKLLEERHFATAAKSRYGERAGRLARNVPQEERYYVDRPYHRVEFDAHRIDYLMMVIFKLPNGDTQTQLLKRLWILTIIDTATRCILGKYISFHENYTSEDVLRCIQNAIVPWKKKELQIPGLTYNKDAGMPSDIKECAWGLWDEISYDNAKSNISQIVVDRLENYLYSSVIRGPVETPEFRSIQETFYRTLEESFGHRLPSTTGSSTSDIRRQNPEKMALQYKITHDELEELSDVVIANYNGEPHSELYWHSPLETLKQRLTPYESEEPRFEIRILPESERDNLRFFTMTDKRKVVGNIKQGRRPYINWKNARYTSSILADSPDLIGKTLSLEIDIDDVRRIRAYLPSGAELGELYAVGGWGRTKHSLKTRETIIQLYNEKQLHYLSNDDPIIIYQNFLREKSKKDRASANALVTLIRGAEESGDYDNIVHEDNLTPTNANNKSKKANTENNITKDEASERSNETNFNKIDNGDNNSVNTPKLRLLKKAIVF